MNFEPAFFDLPARTITMHEKLLTILLCLCIIPVFPATGYAQVFSYAEAYPGVNYESGLLTDRVTRLIAEIEEGKIALEFDAQGRGYLDSFLAALEIDPSSQSLVFSKTALKTRFVTAVTPRALYFNDDTYIAFIQNSRSLEIATMDPNLGPVFMVLAQDPEEISVERELNRCLRCHDSYSMTGGGVPRFLLSSVLADPDGEIVTHEISIMTDTSTRLDRRWGGFYVTGSHGSQEIMGNFVIDDLDKLRNLNLAVNGNKADLSEYLDTSPYISGGSDIVALMVMEHQVEVQNRISRVNFESRTRIHQQGVITELEVEALIQPLLESLFMLNEVSLTDEVAGTSGFAEYFQSLGPEDKMGRSLREFDLQTRIFKYPLSYLIYSEAIDALPNAVKNVLYRRIRQILAGATQVEIFTSLEEDDRSAIAAILQDTKPEIFQE
ncbi:MAG: hypothetical protein HOH14_03550 [Gammaproteobacteria bacterium]|jgi:hypothetical protein|nr:hypothetical protein [Gammaproteobacteria bacterium]